jgi:ferritin
MRLSEPLLRAFSDQITLELQSSIAYLQLAICLEDQNLSGMARWMQVQSDEERLHALKFITHVTDRGGRPRIGAMDAPGDAAGSVLEAFRSAQAHEEAVSESIRNLYRAVQSEGDIDAIPLLNWFVEEQIEEEATVSEIVGRLELIGDDGAGLLRLDAELGARMPSPVGGGTAAG